MNLDLDWDFVCHCSDPVALSVFRDEGVVEELFEDDLARRVWEYQLGHIRDNGKPATAAVLEHQFDCPLEGPQTTAKDLVARLRERYGRNTGKDIVRNLGRTAFEDPQSLGSEMMQVGRELSKVLNPRGAIFSQDDYEKTIARYHAKVAKGRGPSLGFKDVDDYFYGQLGLTFMVGPPKGGKSWFTLKAFLENIKNGTSSYLYSLELPAEETDMRLRCLSAQIPYWKYLQNQLDPRDLQALEESSDILKDWGQYMIEKPASGFRDVGYLIERARDAGAEAIFLDQLQYIENNKGVAVGATNDTKDYFQVINDLRDLSDDGPIWCVHQFNRSIMNSEAMPEMQQIKGSAAIEECATLVLGLWANKEMRKSHLIQLGTLTSRNYGHRAWEIQMRMRTTCDLQLVGKVEQ